MSFVLFFFSIAHTVSLVKRSDTTWVCDGMALFHSAIQTYTALLYFTVLSFQECVTLLC